jgi:hypothetical protein
MEPSPDVLPPFFWALSSAYLIVAAVVLFETEFRSVDDEPPDTLTLCVFALYFAAGWPFRAARGVLRRLTSSS